MEAMFNENTQLPSPSNPGGPPPSTAKNSMKEKIVTIHGRILDFDGLSDPIISGNMRFDNMNFPPSSPEMRIEYEQKDLRHLMWEPGTKPVPKQPKPIINRQELKIKASAALKSIPHAQGPSRSLTAEEVADMEATRSAQASRWLQEEKSKALTAKMQTSERLEKVRVMAENARQKLLTKQGSHRQVTIDLIKPEQLPSELRAITSSASLPGGTVRSRSASVPSRRSSIKLNTSADDADSRNGRTSIRPSVPRLSAAYVIKTVLKGVDKYNGMGDLEQSTVLPPHAKDLKQTKKMNGASSRKSDRRSSATMDTSTSAAQSFRALEDSFPSPGVQIRPRNPDSNYSLDISNLNISGLHPAADPGISLESDASLHVTTPSPNPPAPENNSSHPRAPVLKRLDDKAGTGSAAMKAAEDEAQIRRIEGQQYAEQRRLQLKQQRMAEKAAQAEAQAKKQIALQELDAKSRRFATRPPDADSLRRLTYQRENTHNNVTGTVIDEPEAMGEDKLVTASALNWSVAGDEAATWDHSRAERIKTNQGMQERLSAGMPPVTASGIVGLQKSKLNDPAPTSSSTQTRNFPTRSSTVTYSTTAPSPRVGNGIPLALGGSTLRPSHPFLSTIGKNVLKPKGAKMMKMKLVAPRSAAPQNATQNATVRSERAIVARRSTGNAAPLTALQTSQNVYPASTRSVRVTATKIRTHAQIQDAGLIASMAHELTDLLDTTITLGPAARPAARKSPEKRRLKGEKKQDSNNGSAAVPVKIAKSTVISGQQSKPKIKVSSKPTKPSQTQLFAQSFGGFGRPAFTKSITADSPSCSVGELRAALAATVTSMESLQQSMEYSRDSAASIDTEGANRSDDEDTNGLHALRRSIQYRLAEAVNSSQTELGSSLPTSQVSSPESSPAKQPLAAGRKSVDMLAQSFGGPGKHSFTNLLDISAPPNTAASAADESVEEEIEEDIEEEEEDEPSITEYRNQSSNSMGRGSSAYEEGDSVIVETDEVDEYAVELARGDRDNEDLDAVWNMASLRAGVNNTTPTVPFITAAGSDAKDLYSEQELAALDAAMDNREDESRRTQQLASRERANANHATLKELDARDVEASAGLVDDRNEILARFGVDSSPGMLELESTPTIPPRLHHSPPSTSASSEYTSSRRSDTNVVRSTGQLTDMDRMREKIVEKAKQKMKIELEIKTQRRLSSKGGSSLRNIGNIAGLLASNLGIAHDDEGEEIVYRDSEFHWSDEENEEPSADGSETRLVNIFAQRILEEQTRFDAVQVQKEMNREQLKRDLVGKAAEAREIFEDKAKSSVTPLAVQSQGIGASPKGGTISPTRSSKPVLSVTNQPKRSPRTAGSTSLSPSAMDRARTIELQRAKNDRKAESRNAALGKSSKLSPTNRPSPTRSTASTRSSEFNVDLDYRDLLPKETSEPVTVEPTVTEDSASSFWDSLLAGKSTIGTIEAPAGMTAEDIESVRELTADFFMVRSPSSATNTGESAAASIQTGQPAPRLTPQEMHLRMQHALRKHDELYSLSLELSEIEQQNAIVSAQHVVQQITNETEKELTEFRVKQELALQQQAYELSLSTAVHAVQHSLQMESNTHAEQISMLLERIREQEAMLASNARPQSYVTSQPTLSQEPKNPPLQQQAKVHPRTAQDEDDSYSTVFEDDDERSFRGTARRNAPLKSAPRQRLSEATLPSDRSMHSIKSERSVLTDHSIDEDSALEVGDGNSVGDARSVSTAGGLAPARSPAFNSRRSGHESDYSEVFDELSFSEAKSALSDSGLDRSDSDFDRPRSWRDVKDSLKPRASFTSPSRKNAAASPARSGERKNRDRLSASGSMDSRINVHFKESPKRKRVKAAGSNFNPAPTAKSLDTLMALRSMVPDGNTDQTITAYRIEIESRLRGMERGLALRLQLLESKHKSALDAIATARKNVGQNSKDQARLDEEEAIVQEEFMEEMSSIEREKWGISARAYRELRKFHVLKRDMDTYSERLGAIGRDQSSAARDRGPTSSTTSLTSSQASPRPLHISTATDTNEQSVPTKETLTTTSSSAASVPSCQPFNPSDSTDTITELELSITLRQRRIQDIQENITQLADNQERLAVIKQKQAERQKLIEMEEKLLVQARILSDPNSVPAPTNPTPLDLETLSKIKEIASKLTHPLYIDAEAIMGTDTSVLEDEDSFGSDNPFVEGDLLDGAIGAATSKSRLTLSNLESIQRRADAVAASRLSKRASSCVDSGAVKGDLAREHAFTVALEEDGLEDSFGSDGQIFESDATILALEASILKLRAAKQHAEQLHTQASSSGTQHASARASGERDIVSLKAATLEAEAMLEEEKAKRARAASLTATEKVIHATNAMLGSPPALAQTVVESTAVVEPPATPQSPASSILDISRDSDRSTKSSRRTDVIAAMDKILLSQGRGRGSPSSSVSPTAKPIVATRTPPSRPSPTRPTSSSPLTSIPVARPPFTAVENEKEAARAMADSAEIELSEYSNESSSDDADRSESGDHDISAAEQSMSAALDNSGVSAARSTNSAAMTDHSISMQSPTPALADAVAQVLSPTNSSHSQHSPSKSSQLTPSPTRTAPTLPRSSANVASEKRSSPATKSIAESLDDSGSTGSMYTEPKVAVTPLKSLVDHSGDFSVEGSLDHDGWSMEDSFDRNKSVQIAAQSRDAASVANPDFSIEDSFDASLNRSRSIGEIVEAIPSSMTFASPPREMSMRVDEEVYESPSPAHSPQPKLGSPIAEIHSSSPDQTHDDTSLAFSLEATNDSIVAQQELEPEPESEQEPMHEESQDEVQHSFVVPISPSISVEMDHLNISTEIDPLVMDLPSSPLSSSLPLPSYEPSTLAARGEILTESLPSVAGRITELEEKIRRGSTPGKADATAALTADTETDTAAVASETEKELIPEMQSNMSISSDDNDDAKPSLEPTHSPAPSPAKYATAAASPIAQASVSPARTVDDEDEHKEREVMREVEDESSSEIEEDLEGIDEQLSAEVMDNVPFSPSRPAESSVVEASPQREKFTSSPASPPASPQLIGNSTSPLSISTDRNYTEELPSPGLEDTERISLVQAASLLNSPRPFGSPKSPGLMKSPIQGDRSPKVEATSPTRSPTLAADQYSPLSSSHGSSSHTPNHNPFEAAATLPLSPTRSTPHTEDDAAVALMEEDITIASSPVRAIPTMDAFEEIDSPTSPIVELASAVLSGVSVMNDEDDLYSFTPPAKAKAVTPLVNPSTLSQTQSSTANSPPLSPTPTLSPSSMGSQWAARDANAVKNLLCSLDMPTILSRLDDSAPLEKNLVSMSILETAVMDSASIPKDYLQTHGAPLVDLINEILRDLHESRHHTRSNAGQRTRNPYIGSSSFSFRMLAETMTLNSDSLEGIVMKTFTQLQQQSAAVSSNKKHFLELVHSDVVQDVVVEVESAMAGAVDALVDRILAGLLVDEVDDVYDAAAGARK